MKNKQRLFATLLGLVGLLVVGCTAVEGEPTAVAIAETSPTVLPTETATLRPTEPATVLPTATEISMPLPTYTSHPAPVYQILFVGTPCRGESSYCSGLVMNSDLQWYQINSDGSGLKRLAQLENPDWQIEMIRFSADGSQMAYFANRRIFLADLANTNPVELVSFLPEEYALLGGFDFMPNSNCLAVYRNVDMQRYEFAKITVQKVCPNEAEPEILGVIELPDLRPATRSYLSPQGDAILILGGDREGNYHLSIFDFGSNSSPTHLFALSQETHISPLQWHSSGEYIEFVAIEYLGEHPEDWTYTYYAIDRTGHRLEMQYPLENPESEHYLFQATNWLPNGTEIVVPVRYMPHEQSGLYVYHLVQEDVRQFLQNFYIAEVYISSPEFP